ncbi:PPC domain-containing protein [Fimbriiglobus ruber]|uniref:Putative serine proteinase, subtilase family n=1 Tax=Fimbriiglobus ruber TaxID=1908690 RepID=A0A225ECV6_9BACT|nr:PPC domain-containing protein [Fimbriiglobus ruber]OWK47179.1 putative serine proteinase, subtilase family [Fimbriiglobus ruber]
MKSVWLTGFVLLALCGEVHAAPSLTYFFPTGAQRGTTTEVTAAGAFDKWPVKVWVSGKGVAATAGKEKGKLSFVVAADAVPGMYWVRVYDETGASGLRPFAVGLLPEVLEKEPNDDPATAQVIDPPARVVNGRLAKAGEVDCYAVKLTKGQTLVASVDANQTFKSPMDAIVQVVTTDGFVLDQNNDVHGLDPQIAFTAPRDGTFVVRVFAFPSMPDSTIRFSGGDAYVYRLTLTTGGFADYAWPLAVAREGPASVALVGWNIPEAARMLTVPKVAPGEDAPLFHPAVANPITVAVEPHPCWDAATLTGKPTPLAPPFTISGQLSKTGPRDRFPLAVKKGVALNIRVAAPSLGFPLSPVIQISDATGKVVARAEPAGLTDDSELTFTPPSDGPFTLEVRDLLQANVPRQCYRLTVQKTEPDFALTVPVDRLACTPDKPTEVVVTVVRKNGLTADIAITAEDLPPGVIADAFTAGKDAKTVTFRLKADKPFEPRTIRLVGRTKGSPETTRITTAALPDLDTTTKDLWLGPSSAEAAPKKKRK